MINCYFQIPRGKTNRYVFVFYLINDKNYLIYKKVLQGNFPYKIIKTYNIPKNNLNTFINTVVANVY